MTTYVDPCNQLWTELENVPPYLKTHQDRLYNTSYYYQYTMISRLPQVRDALIINDVIYVIDIQYNLWLFHPLYPCGIISPIKNVRRLYRVRDIIIMIDVDNRLSRLIQCTPDINTWFKITFIGTKFIIAMMIQLGVLIMLTTERTVIIGYIDLFNNLIITTSLPFVGIRQLIGPLLVDNHDNLIVLDFNYYHTHHYVGATSVNNKIGEPVIDVDYNRGLIIIGESGQLYYQDIHHRLICLNNVISFKCRFKSFIRLRQNHSQSIFIKDRSNIIWCLDLNVVNLERSCLARVRYGDRPMTVQYHPAEESPPSK